MRNLDKIPFIPAERGIAPLGMTPVVAFWSATTATIATPLLWPEIAQTGFQRCHPTSLGAGICAEPDEDHQEDTRGQPAVVERPVD
jgi:hypothetical protein